MPGGKLRPPTGIRPPVVSPAAGGILPRKNAKCGILGSPVYMQMFVDIYGRPQNAAFGVLPGQNSPCRRGDNRGPDSGGRSQLPSRHPPEIRILKSLSSRGSGNRVQPIRPYRPAKDSGVAEASICAPFVFTRSSGSAFSREDLAMALLTADRNQTLSVLP